MMNHTLHHSPPAATIPTVASDFDGTITTGQAWKGMRDYLIAHGHARAFRLFFLRRLPSMILFRLGLVNVQKFRENWMLGMLGLFKGVSYEEFQQMANWVVEQEIWPNRRQAVVDELQQHKQNGYRVIIITGMFEPILAFVAQKLAVEGFGTPIEFQNNICTGRIKAPFNKGERKVAQLQPFSHHGKIEIAYGDTWPDIPMLEMSAHPVAVHPDDRLRKVAQERGWRILME